MGVSIMEPNSCVRGCCTSSSIPLHLPPSSFTLHSPIARGAESVVYEATLDGRRVAVKKPVLATSDDLDKFHNELQLLCKLDHPGLAKLIAAHAKPPNYLFFYEFYESPNLSEKLHSEEWSPDIDQVLGISLRLAKALQYLHNLGILHRDVKPANILLDRDLIPYLADFGLAEHKKALRKVCVENWRSSGKPTGGFHKKSVVGTLIYMAPEILKKDLHTEKSDVYSFGISINELITGVVPYTDLRAEAQAHTVLEMNYTEQQLTAAVVSEHLRPVLAGPESGTPSSLSSLIRRCWDSNPENRPSFDEIVSELSLISEPFLARNPISLDRHSLDISRTVQAFQEAVDWSTQGDRLSRKAASEADSSSLTIWTDSLDDSSDYHPILSCGSFATCGRRETMEDTHFIMPRFGDARDVHVFGIFDGHRGAEAAEFTARALPGCLQSFATNNSPTDALVKAFVETDRAFRSEVDFCRESKRVIQKEWHPGCCAIAALIVKNKLFVANAGDCRAILCRAGRPIALSKDHVASCLDERERVVGAGGHIKWQIDTWRVGAAALQVTRSIGDDDLKPAVTAEPEITESILSSEDEYLVMASDGLWDVVSNEDVIHLIRDTVKEPVMCSKRLATEAATRGSKDNITVVVVFLRPVSTAERIY